MSCFLTLPKVHFANQVGNMSSCTTGVESTGLAYSHSRKWTLLAKFEKFQASPPGVEPIRAGKPGKCHVCAAVDESYTITQWLAHLSGKQRSMVRIAR